MKKVMVEKNPVIWIPESQVVEEDETVVLCKDCLGKYIGEMSE